MWNDGKILQLLGEKSAYTENKPCKKVRVETVAMKSRILRADCHNLATEGTHFSY